MIIRPREFHLRCDACGKEFPNTTEVLPGGWAVIWRGDDGFNPERYDSYHVCPDCWRRYAQINQWYNTGAQTRVYNYVGEAKPWPPVVK